MMDRVSGALDPSLGSSDGDTVTCGACGTATPYLVELDHRWVGDAPFVPDFPEYLCGECGLEYGRLSLGWNTTVQGSAPVSFRDLPDDTIQSIPWCDFCANSIDQDSPRLLHMNQFSDGIEEWGCFLFCPNCARVLENFFDGLGGDPA